MHSWDAFEPRKKIVAFFTMFFICLFRGAFYVVFSAFFALSCDSICRSKNRHFFILVPGVLLVEVVKLLLAAKSHEVRRQRRLNQIFVELLVPTGSEKK